MLKHVAGADKVGGCAVFGPIGTTQDAYRSSTCLFFGTIGPARIETGAMIAPGLADLPQEGAMAAADLGDPAALEAMAPDQPSDRFLGVPAETRGEVERVLVAVPIGDPVRIESAVEDMAAAPAPRQGYIAALDIKGRPLAGGGGVAGNRHPLHEGQMDQIFASADNAILPHHAHRVSKVGRQPRAARSALTSST
jgi:hypothetical protein